MVFLAIWSSCQMAKAIKVEPIEPGIHVEKIGHLRKVEKNIRLIYTIKYQNVWSYNI